MFAGRFGSEPCTRGDPETGAILQRLTDRLDGGIVPGTTLPEPGGIDFRRLRDLLVAIAGQGRVVGFDIVETSAAQLDVNTSMTTAWLMVHFLSAIHADRSTRP